MLPLVTYTSKYYQEVYPHVDPHLSQSTAQQWVSMCIRPTCIYVGHLEVFSWDRTGIANMPCRCPLATIFQVHPEHVC